MALWSHERDALWRRVITTKYGSELAGWFTVATTEPYRASL